MTGMRSFSKLLVCAGLVLLVVHPGMTQACDGIDPLSLVPDNGMCPGVTRDGETLTAYTIPELQDLINGGYEVFANHGFVAMALQNYLIDIGGSPAVSSLYLYNQGTSANAEALYDELASGSWEAVSDWGGSGEARVKTALFSITFEFHEACFYGSIVVMSLDDQAVSSARCIAEAIVAGIQGCSPVDSECWSSLKVRYK
jgi:hypothetical protein